MVLPPHFPSDYLSTAVSFLPLTTLNGRMRETDVNLLNYSLSRARCAVKVRRNSAHYEQKKADVWRIVQNVLIKNVKTLLLGETVM